jgi:hypothetical protein
MTCPRTNTLLGFKHSSSDRPVQFAYNFHPAPTTTVSQFASSPDGSLNFWDPSCNNPIPPIRLQLPHLAESTLSLSRLILALGCTLHHQYSDASNREIRNVLILGFWTCPSSGILQNTKGHGVSETGSVSVLGWGGGRLLTVLGPLGITRPSHWTAGLVILSASNILNRAV